MAHILFPEQSPQDGVGVKAQKFITAQGHRQMGDSVEVLRLPDGFFVALPVGARQIGFTAHGQALNQESGGHLVVGCQHQPRVKLLGLQHVMLQYLRQVLQRLALVAMQGHHALVGLLTRQTVPRVQGDGATAFAMDV